MNITLYTTQCPKCLELENLLVRNKIQYTKITDIKIMKKNGFVSVPMLMVNGQTMTFEDAKTWIIRNNQGGTNEQ